MGYDVAIIGGGPGGSTCSSLIRKYNPSLKVVVIEKERFPREHVGESQLPLIGSILNEMGVWEKVEEAGFPIKLGATYRWGNSNELWDFEFIPHEQFKDEPRPATFSGQRLWTAFQVERSIYDKILLDHAVSLGVEVREETRVAEVARDGNRVAGLVLESGEKIEAKHYVDASGHVGILRRAMGVECEYPGNIKNVAFWDYWDNAEWAVTIGTGGTRVFVLSIGCGWIWFIPIRPHRVSVGFICPAEYYRTCGKTPEELYTWAIQQDPLCVKHLREAHREGETRTTKDWSFLSEKMRGPNWFLVGEAAGFADPILAGGLMLTHAGARELAYVILELERGEHDAEWLRSRYESLQRRRIGQHIRFADFWYAGNGCFTDLEQMTSAIAKDAGIRLDPKQAFQWLSNGGFQEDIPGRAGVGGVDLAAAKKITGILTNNQDVGWQVNQFNIFKLNLTGAKEEFFPILANGRIFKTKCFQRGAKVLPLVYSYQILVEVLKKHSYIMDIARELMGIFQSRGNSPAQANIETQQAIQALEVMLVDGWVWGQLDPKRQRLVASDPKQAMIHVNEDVQGVYGSGNGAPA